MTIARRRFLQTTMGLAAGWALHEATGAEGSPQAKKIPIALQLYAVRGDFAATCPARSKRWASSVTRASSSGVMAASRRCSRGMAPDN